MMDFSSVLSEAYKHMTVALQLVILNTSLTAEDVAVEFSQRLALQRTEIPEPSLNGVTPAEHRLIAMGFDAEMARRALQLASGDLSAAVSIIVET